MSQPVATEVAKPRSYKRALGCTGAIIAVPLASCAIIAIAYFSLLHTICGNTVGSTIPSPDHKINAVAFGRSCGSTTGGNTQVSLIADGATLPNTGGNCFSADMGDDKKPGASTCGEKGDCPPVIISWTGPRSLQVVYPPKTRFLQQEQSVRVVGLEKETVTVEYKAAKS